MFYGQCFACGERWSLGTASTCKCPDLPDYKFSVPSTSKPVAKKQWVDLTDQEMNDAMDYWSEDCRSAYGGAHAADGEYVSMIDTWRYIEAKLREKNDV